MQRAREAGCPLTKTIALDNTKPGHPRGPSHTCAPTWVGKHLTMYYLRQESHQGKSSHWNIVADPAVHAYRDRCVAVGWSWQESSATFPVMQSLRQGEYFACLESELDLSLAQRVKLERVAAYRQLQALSHMAMQLSGRSLWDFRAPEICIRAIRSGEVRLLRQEGGQQRAVFVEVKSGQETSIMPPHTKQIPLLTTGLDQGSVGL